MWQARPAGCPPVAVTHGIESHRPKSIAELLRVARGVTLLTRQGEPVIVNELTHTGGGAWSGTVVMVGAGAEHIRLGTVVEFREEHVQDATLT